LPLTSAAKARELQRRQVYGLIPDDVIDRISQSADAVQEGVEIASEVAAQLKGIRGVRGIHILTGGCESGAGDVLYQITKNIKTTRPKIGDAPLFSAGEYNGNRKIGYSIGSANLAASIGARIVPAAAIASNPAVVLTFITTNRLTTAIPLQPSKPCMSAKPAFPAFKAAPKDC
jgi:hypothetical protein